MKLICAQPVPYRDASPAPHTSYTVSGGFNASYRGVYPQTGTYNGFPLYELTPGGKAIWASSGGSGPPLWYLSGAAGGSPSLRH